MAVPAVMRENAQNDLTASFETAWRLCRKCLTQAQDPTQADRKAVPRKEFIKEYTTYIELLELAREEFATGDRLIATQLLWEFCYTHILDNPQLIAFFIINAYNKLVEVVQEFGRGLEGQDEWTTLILKARTFEQHFWAILAHEGEPDSKKLYTIAKNGLVTELSSIFTLQQELCVSKAQMLENMNRRKDVIYSAMALYAVCGILQRIKHRLLLPADMLEVIEQKKPVIQQQPKTKRGRKRAKLRESNN